MVESGFLKGGKMAIFCLTLTLPISTTVEGGLLNKQSDNKRLLSYLYNNTVIRVG